VPGDPRPLPAPAPPLSGLPPSAAASPVGPGCGGRRVTAASARLNAAARGVAGVLGVVHAPATAGGALVRSRDGGVAQT